MESNGKERGHPPLVDLIPTDSISYGEIPVNYSGRSVEPEYLDTSLMRDALLLVDRIIPTEHQASKGGPPTQIVWRSTGSILKMPISIDPQPASP